MLISLLRIKIYCKSENNCFFHYTYALGCLKKLENTPHIPTDKILNVEARQYGQNMTIKHTLKSISKFSRLSVSNLLTLVIMRYLAQ